MPSVPLGYYTSKMKSAPLPPNEEKRLSNLYAYGILDSLDEKEYDEVAQLVAQICETPMANISFIDRDRQWLKSVVGLEDRETSRDVAFCSHTILGDEILTVEDASQDERFSDNPLVTENPGIRFYAGMPLISPEGHRLGALCAIDGTPRRLTETQQQSLRVLSRHVITLLELRRRNRELEALSDLKTRLLAIIGHDLRSPLANLSSAVSLMRGNDLSESETAEVITDLEKTLRSTESLVDNLVSWARRNLDVVDSSPGDSIDLAALGDDLVRAIEADAERKGNAITAHLNGLPRVHSDRDILEFILRNLLVNANKFTEGGRITLTGSVEDQQVVVKISDTGIGMNSDQIGSLFDWKARSRVAGTRGEKGSGLALLLSKDMADRIGASIGVESEVGVGTTFILRLPAG